MSTRGAPTRISMPICGRICCQREGGGGLNKGVLGYSQNVVSAINKLPVYPGNVYRHGNFFSGYKELNRPGAVLTDLAFREYDVPA